MILGKLSKQEKAADAKKTRIQAMNKEKIIEAATKVFAQYGYRGATVEQIAKKAGMSKPNLLYYYKTKKILYLGVVQGILDTWLGPLQQLNVDQDPEQEICAYIERKIEYSRIYPLASKVFANEMLEGASILKPVLETHLKEIVKKKASVLRKWKKQGKIADIDPYHFIFMIWAVTQTYADFAVQIEAVTGKTLDNDAFYRQTKKNIKQVLMHGFLK